MPPVVRRVSSVEVQVEVPRLSGAEAPDYRDAFEVSLDKPDARTAEQWARAALEHAPTAVRWVVLIAHRGVLRLRLGPMSSPEYVLGWKIPACQPDKIELATDGPVMRGLIVGYRISPTTTQIETLLYFHRRPLGRAIWAVVGPVHRRVAPLLLRRAASAR